MTFQEWRERAQKLAKDLHEMGDLRLNPSAEGAREIDEAFARLEASLAELEADNRLRDERRRTS